MAKWSFTVVAPYPLKKSFGHPWSSWKQNTKCHEMYWLIAKGSIGIKSCAVWKVDHESSGALQ